MRVLGRVLLFLELRLAAVGLAPGLRSVRLDKAGHLASSAAGDLAESFIRVNALKQRVRICNGYQSDDESLDIYFAPQVITQSGAKEKHVTYPEQMVSEEPLSYKTCKRYNMQLTKNDHIVFKSGNSTVGTYLVNVPTVNDTVQGLVIFRRGSEPLFEQRTFSGVEQPQVWAINAYDGAAEANLHLADHWRHITWQNGGETVGYNSMMPIKRGKYEAILVNPDGDDVTTSTLVALPHEGYIVMRVGMETEKTNTNAVEPFPQEIVVFPKSDPSLLTGAAAEGRAPLSLVFLAVLGALAST